MAPGPSKLEWQRALVTLAAVTLFVVVVAAVYWARSIFIPVALAVFLTFVMSPVVGWLERRGLGRVPAVLGTVALGVLFVGTTGGLVAWQLASLTKELPKYTDRIKGKLLDAKQTLVGGEGESRFGKMIDDVSSVIIPPKPEPAPGVPRVVVEPQGASWFTQAEEYVSPALEVVGQFAFGFILAVFMLLKKEDLRNRLIRLTGDTRVTTTTKAVDDASKRVSRYLFNQLLLNTAFGMIITVVLFAIDVPYSLLWGFLASVMRYIPYIGTWLGVVPPVVVTLALTDTWWQPLTVAGVYAGLELTSNNVLEPRLYGSSLGLSEVAQLVATAFWAFLWGPIGLILSGPLTVCLLVLGKYVPRFQFLEVLLGDEPALPPDVRLYQRLAARDQDEATAIAHESLKAGSAEQAFDDVLIPALGYARRDIEEQTLSKDDLHAILDAAREITDDLLDSRLLTAADRGTEATTPPARVLALPARDEVDRVALEMLRGLLDPVKWEVEVAPVESLTSEVLALVGAVKPGAIVIGSLPPGGLAHTRYLCKRLSRQFPNARIVVGRWGLTTDAEENRRQLAEAGADHVTTTLAETIQHLAAWGAVLTTQQEPEADEGAGKSAGRGKVGTPAASGSVA